MLGPLATGSLCLRAQPLPGRANPSFPASSTHFLPGSHNEAMAIITVLTHVWDLRVPGQQLTHTKPWNPLTDPYRTCSINPFFLLRALRPREVEIPAQGCTAP